ncbi:hypothetical protein AG1IA_00658 [Rhizoctonia solani AG-1 IA]|uniref:Uncharacterized protein n=1 Tax=Thanatephorus cucumeris (strain AG1-IA) TaxID=983506 RepID=L8X4V2_THACA|nr:hypothetical protein AG1IA_00658 [Rhizoctonia solani AG-1 IA]
MRVPWPHPVACLNESKRSVHPLHCVAMARVYIYADVVKIIWAEIGLNFNSFVSGSYASLSSSLTPSINGNNYWPAFRGGGHANPSIL